MKDGFMALGVLLAALLLLFCWPLVVIWGLNTLFGTAIPYGLNTWLATVVLVSVVRVCLHSPEKP